MIKEYSNTQISCLIDEYIHNQRDRDILKDRFINGLLFKELEIKYNLSMRQIKRIVQKADKLLIKYL